MVTLPYYVVITAYYLVVVFMLLKWYIAHVCWRRSVVLGRRMFPALRPVSVVRVPVPDWRTFPDMHLIYGWRVTTSWVRHPLCVNQPGQLSLLPLVGQGMSSLSVDRCMRLLAAVSPSSECVYEGKTDVVYLQVG